MENPTDPLGGDQSDKNIEDDADEGENPEVEVVSSGNDPTYGFFNNSDDEDEEESYVPPSVPTIEVVDEESDDEATEVVSVPSPFISKGDSEPRFVTSISANDSRLRQLESWLGASVYPVVSTGVLKASARLASSKEYVRTLSIKGGLVPAFVAWSQQMTFFLPKKLVKCDAQVGGVYTRGERFPSMEGYNAFFSMDRRVVLVKTNSRSTLFVPPRKLPQLWDGAVLSPCDLKIEELENDQFFTQLTAPITEEQIYNNLFTQFKKETAFWDVNYFDVMPRGWKLSKPAREKVEEIYNSSLPSELFPERDGTTIMCEALLTLVHMGLLSEEDIADMTTDEMGQFYVEFATNHPDLLSNSAEDLGSGFNILRPNDARGDDDNRNVILDISTSTSEFQGERGVLKLERATENFQFSARLEIQEFLGSCRGKPIPVSWPACTYERASSHLNRVMAILTTAAKLRQGVVFVRGEVQGTVGVRLRSAQPYKKSQNTTVKGGRNQKNAIWMETRECAIEGEFWFPVSQSPPLREDYDEPEPHFTSPSPSLHALIRDAQNLIMTGIITNQLDPSAFGPVVGPYLSVLPFDHEVNVDIGEMCEQASFVAPFFGGHNEELKVITRNREYVDNPVNPLYGLPDFLEQFATRIDSAESAVTPKGDLDLPITIVRDPNGSWDYPALPLLAIYDREENGYVEFPLPYHINSVEKYEGSAVDIYELLTARGTTSSIMAKHTIMKEEVVLVEPSGKSTMNEKTSEGNDSKPKKPPDEGIRVAKAPGVRQRRQGVSIEKSSGVTVATHRTKTGKVVEDRSYGLRWLGPFADCPAKHRHLWKENLHALTWLSGKPNPSVAARANVLRVWTRPLRKSQEELKLSCPSGVQIGEYVTRPYDKTTFDWSTGPSV